MKDIGKIDINSKTWMFIHCRPPILLTPLFNINHKKNIFDENFSLLNLINIQQKQINVNIKIKQTFSYRFIHLSI